MKKNVEDLLQNVQAFSLTIISKMLSSLDNAIINYSLPHNAYIYLLFQKTTRGKKIKIKIFKIHFSKTCNRFVQHLKVNNIKIICTRRKNLGAHIFIWRQ